jgi:hypothetical protein
MSAVKTLGVLLLLVACDKKTAPKPAEGSGSPTVAPVSADAAVVAIADAGLDAGATVDAAAIACTAAAIGQARKQADAHVKAGNFDAAIALLQDDGCYLQEEQPAPLKEQIAWRLSDLSFAYFKAKQFGNCYAVAAAQTPPYAGNVGFFFNDGDKVMTALEYNAKICQEAAAKERGPFASVGPCAFDEDAHSLPASELAATDKAACLVFAPDKQDGEGMNECGGVALVRQSKKGKLSRTKLSVGEGNLGNGSVCCNLEAVSFGKRGANLAILIETRGRDCNGGTASSEEQHAYELQGTTLELFHALNAVAH